jgi:hypothetical protein
VRTSKNNGLVASMGRVATAGHNAAMESFHALLQKNVLNTQGRETREELRLAIVTESNAPITDGIAGVVSRRCLRSNLKPKRALVPCNRNRRAEL